MESGEIENHRIRQIAPSYLITGKNYWTTIVLIDEGSPIQYKENVVYWRSYFVSQNCPFLQRDDIKLSIEIVDLFILACFIRWNFPLLWKERQTFKLLRAKWIYYTSLGSVYSCIEFEFWKTTSILYSNECLTFFWAYIQLACLRFVRVCKYVVCRPNTFHRFIRFFYRPLNPAIMDLLHSSLLEIINSNNENSLISSQLYWTEVIKYDWNFFKLTNTNITNE